ncbi:MAG: hypothetical protein ACFNLD_03130 [Kingella oralis]|jgi:hypothetical protein|uniref:hypothetical protein n=1 Tax=Kingella oralis TaxID=505 RepID=UPI0034E5053C
MENNELDEFQLLIEQGVVSNEQKATELEKLGYVKVTPEGFNDFAKKFAEEMKERFPETAEPDWAETIMGIKPPKIVRH